MISNILAAATILASSVYAHGGVDNYVLDGVLYPGWQPYSPSSGPPTIQRPWPSYDPLLTSTGANIRCQTGNSVGAPLTGTVKAGGTVKATWKQWTHAEGPVTVYLAKCPGACSSFDGSGKVWFKIDEAGLLSGTLGKGKWGNGVVLDTLSWSSTIPSTLAPGEYLMRHELLALHQANTPQFYPECAQITVTGSGTASPSSEYLVSFPGAFSDSDPGVHVNIYDASQASSTTYIVPGPPVWKGTGGGSVPTTIRTSSVAPTTVRTSSVAPTTVRTTSVAPTTTVVSGGLPAYAQCGGIGYSGSTVCAAGLTCVKNGDYYSQCRP